jgi:hypothetical protein
MNNNTVSSECAMGMCSSCRFEDCACECHIDEDVVSGNVTFEEEELEAA